MTEANQADPESTDKPTEQANIPAKLMKDRNQSATHGDADEMETFDGDQDEAETGLDSSENNGNNSAVEEHKVPPQESLYSKTNDGRK